VVVLLESDDAVLLEGADVVLLLAHPTTNMATQTAAAEKRLTKRA
jgi:hypothetical protein